MYWKIYAWAHFIVKKQPHFFEMYLFKKKTFSTQSILHRSLMSNLIEDSWTQIFI